MLGLERPDRYLTPDQKIHPMGEGSNLMIHLESEKKDSWVLSSTQWLLLFCGAFVSAAVRGFQTKSFQQTHTLMNGYIASFYFLTYAGGGRRRALIGSLLAALHPGGLSLRALNLLALLILCSLLAFFLQAVLHAAANATLKQRLLYLALCAGVLISIQWEILGDLLQIDLLLFLLGALALRRLRLHDSLRLGLAILLFLLMALVHEAAIFLFPAFLPFVTGKRPTLRQLAFPVAFAVVLLGLSLHWGGTPPSDTANAAPTAQAATPETNTPPFTVLLGEEGRHDFGSVRLFAAFGSRFLRILSLLYACLVVCATTLGSRAKGFLQTFLRALLISLPLWVIAHDWGRFVSDLILLTFFCEFLLLQSPEQPVSPALDRLNRFITQAQSFPFLLAGVAVFLLGAGFEARVSGMDLRGFLAALPFLAFALWAGVTTPAAHASAPRVK